MFMPERRKEQYVIISILIIIAVMILSITSCASISDTTIKTMAITKVTVEEAVRTAKQLYAAGDLSEDNLFMVKEYYERARMANDLVIDSMILALDLGNNPIEDADYNAAYSSFQKTMDDFWNLAVELNLVKRSE